jgi:hypothetical protein
MKSELVLSFGRIKDMTLSNKIENPQIAEEI